MPDGLDIDTVYVSEGPPPLTQEQVEALDPANEYVVECTDPAALEAHAGREPAGWPQDWEPGDPLPDPECHPDFIEVHTWDRFEEFHECREGIETSTIVRTPEMTDQAAYRAAWEQSRARATWEPEQTCEEMLSHLSD
ncbi:hypothetical protein [Nesterenkonia sp.]|uniref:hypothetical protein n=1 Tax=Nesterenkonia sp. TaxID=704201 RepID=UPI00260F5474|nr:hypothetical protein [Nesterenkonia sp.]